MIILGISFSHNGSVCILKDGKVIVAIQAERLTRIKRQILDIKKNEEILDKCFEYCLSYSNLSVEDIDFIAFSTPWSINQVKEMCSQWINKLSTKRKIEVRGVSHHLAHAEYIIHYGANINGIVCVIDGSGSYGSEILNYDFCDIKKESISEFSKSVEHTKETVSIYRFKDGKIQTKFKVLGSSTKIIDYGDNINSHRHSIGHLWEIASRIIFDNPNQAGKVMGLLGYNKNKIEKNFMSFDENYKPHINIEIINKEIKKNSSKNIDPLNLAYVSNIIQNDTNNYVLNLLKEFIKKTDKAIYLSGGVMLNIKLNTKISKNFPNKKIIVNGSTEDNGTAIGAAACIYRNITNNNIHEKPTDYYGKKYKSEEIIPQLEKYKLQYKKVKKEDLAKFIAKEILNSKVIMLSNGRSEFGPRALGHRSILANAFDPLTKKKLDTEIKLREPYRPYAPIVLESDYEKIFNLSFPSPFMLFDADVLSDEIPAVTHVDGTARPQTVNKKNGIIYDILLEIKKLKKLPVCLNTSLNKPGEPICEDPEDAIKYALSSKANYLVIENFLITL